MIILAIDPGQEQSGFVLYDSTGKPTSAGEWIMDMGIKSNDDILKMLYWYKDKEYPEVFIYEMVASYGMPVGKSVFETCVWIGRFIEAFNGAGEPIYRKDVKIALCGSMKAKDSNIRQALLDRFPATGGGKTPQVGTKKQPGPLYGVKSHIWSALALAVTYAEKETVE